MDSKDGVAADSGTTDTTTTTTTDGTSGGIDIAAAVEDIGSSLGFGDKGDDSNDDDVQDTAAAGGDTADTTKVDTKAATDTTATAAATDADKAATKHAPPASWAKEKHALWDTLPPEAQEQFTTRENQMLDGIEQYKEHAGFGKTMREVTAPYQAFITAQGVDAPKAVQYLLNAHYRLSTAQPADRATYFSKMAKSYGIDVATLKPDAGDGTTATTAAADPAIAELRTTVQKMQDAQTAKEQTALTERKAKIASEVETFASDPAHKYFDECSDDIVALVNAGHTLKEAYDKAVYANPVTRAKELARLQAESDKALRAKAEVEAKAARKATGHNVRSRDTRKAPTEPKGSMDDTLRATLSEIKERTTH